MVVFSLLLLDGIGTMEYMHGDVYHGQWYKGDMHGKVQTYLFRSRFIRIARKLTFF